MGTQAPKIVSAEGWEAARAALLVKEKEVTRTRDALAASRRRMPMVAVERAYRFEGPEGAAALLDRGDEHGDLWTFLDLTAYGRQEEWEDSPRGLATDAAVPVVALPRPV